MSLDIFKKKCAVRGPDHFVLASGEHSERFVDKWAVFCDPIKTSALCSMLVKKILDKYTGRGPNAEIRAVCGPADGGNIVASHTTWNLLHIQHWNDILYLHTVKDGGGFRFLRGHEKKISGNEILLVEDMLSTGSSALKIANMITALGGKIVCLGALWNRGRVQPEDIGGIKIVSLINKEIPSWPATLEHPCELCQIDRPINTEFGHGQKFLDERSRCL